MKQFIFFFFLFLFFSSCTIETRFVFNEDFSGRTEIIIDFKDLFNDVFKLKLEEIDSVTMDSIMLDSIMIDAKEDFMHELLDDMVHNSSFREEVEKIKGINDIEFLSDPSSVSFFLSFSFNDLESLNRYFIKSSEKDNELYTIDKKNKTILFSIKTNDGIISNNEKFAENIKQKITFVFSRPIKECSLEDALILDSILSFNPLSLSENEVLKIKLK